VSMVSVYGLVLTVTVPVCSYNIVPILDL